MDAIVSLMLKISFVLLAAGGVFIGKKYFNAKEDNLIEEILEEVISNQANLDIDLTPDSQEGDIIPVEKI